MSYVKKDESADQPMMKLDRSSVFQDGIHCSPSLQCALWILILSQQDCSILPLYLLEDVEPFLPRLLCSYSLARRSQRMRPQRSFSAYPSYSKIRIRLCDKWYT